MRRRTFLSLGPALWSYGTIAAARGEGQKFLPGAVVILDPRYPASIDYARSFLQYGAHPLITTNDLVRQWRDLGCGKIPHRSRYVTGLTTGSDLQLIRQLEPDLIREYSGIHDARESGFLVHTLHGLGNAGLDPAAGLQGAQWPEYLAELVRMRSFMPGHPLQIRTRTDFSALPGTLFSWCLCGPL